MNECTHPTHPPPLEVQQLGFVLIRLHMVETGLGSADEQRG